MVTVISLLCWGFIFMKNIKWVSVETWDGIYEAGSNGFIKTLANVSYGGHGKRQKMIIKERVRAFSSFVDGYCLIRLCKRPRQEVHLVHRLIAKAFLPNPENKPEVNHKDGNKKNNDVSNLEWCTEKENTDDAFAKGIKDNSRPKRPKLDSEVVLLIFNSASSLGNLSKLYNLPKLTIQAIKSGKRYARVTGKTYLGKNGRAKIYGQ